PSNDEVPLKDQPLPVDASPTVASPGYVADSDPKEDPEEDHADYPADGGDGDDEPSDDDDNDDETDDEDEEPFEDEEDDEEEEEHLAPADSSVVPIMGHVPPVGDTEAFETDELEPPMSTSIEACIARHAATLTPSLHVPSPPLPLPSPLTTSPTDTGAPVGYRAAGIRMSALLLSTSHRTDIPEADMPPRKRACLTTPAPGFEIEESFVAAAARQPTPDLESDRRRYRVEQTGYEITDTWDEIVDTLMEIAPTTLEGFNQRVTGLDTTVRQRTDEFEVRFEEAQDDRAILRARVNTLFRDRPDNRRTAMLLDREAMYAREAWAGSEDRNAAIAAHVQILEAQPKNFKGTEGVVGLTQWVDKMEYVFLISNCTIKSRVKFASCTLEGSALMWWNSHVRAVGQNVAYAMPWTALKGMITDKYCPRGEIKKLESEMFPEESAKVKRYVGGLFDMIHGSVKASKPQSMQEAIEFATKMMDKKMLTHVERQSENKRKFEDISRNNQNQQQPFKRNNMVWDYTTGPGDKKPYGGTKPLYDLYKLLLVHVMATPAISVSAEENLRDPIDIRMDIIHPEPVAAVAFLAAVVELTALRFRVDIVEAENASLRARIKTTEAIEKITRKRERQARVEIEQQLAAIQESQRQDRDNFRKLKELVTSQFRQHS
nr:hypothetical protein [Tanacetum cinerariifolium]